MAEIKTVGVIGAGQMGTGIAHVCALAGYEVALNDITEERIEAGLRTIRANMARQVAKGYITEDKMEAGLAHIHPAVKLDQIGQADLAIEAATEDEEV